MQIHTVVWSDDFYSLNKTHITSCDLGDAAGVILPSLRFDLLEVKGKKWRLINLGMGNILLNIHHWARDDGLPAIRDFHFRDLENVEVTSKSHPRSKVMTHFN